MKYIHSITSFSLFVFLFGSLCTANDRVDQLIRRTEPTWIKSPLRIDLRPFGGACKAFEFSRDGNYICLWWLPDSVAGDRHKLSGHTVVVDLHGNKVENATNERGELVPDFAEKFTELGWKAHYADFVRDTPTRKTTLWGFTDNRSVGIRLLKEFSNLATTGTLELYSLEQTPVRIWATDFEVGVEERGKVGFFKSETGDRILVAMTGMMGYIFSKADGQLMDKFTYGRPETENELLARRRRFSLPGEKDDSEGHFGASQLAFDPTSKLLACGDHESRRFRVIAVEASHKVMFEANADDDPHKPRGGVWGITRMFFDGGGRYLVVGYQFGGRQTSKYYEPVEIFDTSTWKIVFSVNHPGISSVVPPRISPDGKTLALQNGLWLEIGEFAPNAK